MRVHKRGVSRQTRTLVRVFDFYFREGKKGRVRGKKKRGADLLNFIGDGVNVTIVNGVSIFVLSFTFH
jgi:hypothetical protein